MTPRSVGAVALLLSGCLVVDADGDGWGRAVDCDDANPRLGGPEVPYDGVDNDCDPTTVDDDFDGDGLRHTQDCDDRDSRVGGPEVPYDGVDNDCDPTTLDDDLDGDGLLSDEDCDDTNELRGGDEVVYDGIDNDCDPTTADDDLDGDGVRSAEDCDDQDPERQLSAPWPDDLRSDGVSGFCEGHCARPVIGDLILGPDTSSSPGSTLACVTWVGGDVEIVRTAWGSLDQLGGLTWVGGDLTIQGNTGFADATATEWASGLDDVRGDIVISGNVGAP